MPSSSIEKRSNSGLAETGKRTLMRVILASTGVTLGGFSVLQFLAGNHLFALLEVVMTSVLLYGAWRIVHVRNMTPWIYLYIIPTSAFITYIIIMPDASKAAFVWVYTIPLMSYLLLGRARGFLLSTPLMIIPTVLYFEQHKVALDTAGLIDLGNAVACGLLIIAFVHIYESLRAAAHAQLEHIAQTDALTGVMSRGSFQQMLDGSIAEAERSQAPLVLVIMDIDHFKGVNDDWGHDAGDQALRHMSTLLKQRLRVTDSVGRLGGEEFGVLLRNTDSDRAANLIEALRVQIVSTPLQYGEDIVPLSATFGLAEWPHDGRTSNELYRCADKRLYLGKSRGRNQLVGRDYRGAEMPAHSLNPSL